MATVGFVPGLHEFAQPLIRGTVVAADTVADLDQVVGISLLDQLFEVLQNGSGWLLRVRVPKRLPWNQE